MRRVPVIKNRVRLVCSLLAQSAQRTVFCFCDKTDMIPKARNLVPLQHAQGQVTDRPCLVFPWRSKMQLLKEPDLGSFCFPSSGLSELRREGIHPAREARKKG